MLTSRALGRAIHFNYFSIAQASLFFPALCYHLCPFTHPLNDDVFTQAAGIGEVCLGG